MVHILFDNSIHIHFLQSTKLRVQLSNTCLEASRLWCLQSGYWSCSSHLVRPVLNFTHFVLGLYPPSGKTWRDTFYPELPSPYTWKQSKAVVSVSQSANTPHPSNSRGISSPVSGPAVTGMDTELAVIPVVRNSDCNLDTIVARDHGPEDPEKYDSEPLCSCVEKCCRYLCLSVHFLEKLWWLWPVNND